MTSIQFCYCLCIQLTVIDGDISVYDAVDITAQVATASCRVGEWGGIVGGGNERSHTGQHDILVGAHAPCLYVPFRKHSLDFCLFPFRLGIILVNVHQQHTS